MKKILVAIDGSEHGNKALEKTKEIGLLSNSEIIILYVISSLRNCHPYMLEPEQEIEINKVLLAQGKKILEDAKKVFLNYPSKVTTFIKCGDPAKEIIEKAKKENCDLIVMGSRGLSTFSKIMLGSISNKVLIHSDTSVLIVK